MQRAIFISYRRDDSEGEAGRLYDDLIRVFGADAVFMDVSDIHPGKDFRQAIDDNVAKCAVLLAIIGPGWTTIKDASGVRRLDQPNDFVRLEITSALTRGMDVIPVLVHGARMPNRDELPESLQNLVYRNCVELTHARWNSDVEVLSRALREYVHRGDTFETRTIRKAITGENIVVGAASREPAAEAKSSKPWLKNAAWGIVILAIGGVAIYQNFFRTPPKAPSSTDAHNVSASTSQTNGAPALPSSTSKPVKPAAMAPVNNSLVGTWVASTWRNQAQTSIPVGTPVEFQISQQGDVFSVDMFANDGSGMLSCGIQSVPLTNHGLSMVWDEETSPSCSKYPGMYSAAVRLSMIGDRMRMILFGKYPSTGIDFDRIQ
jgi:hypothetical protein